MSLVTDDAKMKGHARAQWHVRSLFLAVSLMASTTFAATPHQHSRQIDSESAELRQDLARFDQARSWGLTQEEWRRYESLMEGQRGIWSPKLDPITALGVEARTDAERMRYARLLVEIEKKRVERELAFQRDYDHAWQEMYPELSPINTFFSLENTRVNSQFAALETRIAQSPVERVTLVIANQCDACDAIVNRLVAMDANIDIFMVGAKSDADIRQWAIRMALPVERVRSRNITLNHYTGEAVNLENLPLIIE